MVSPQNSPLVGSDPWAQMTGSDQMEGVNRLGEKEIILLLFSTVFGNISSVMILLCTTS